MLKKHTRTTIFIIDKPLWAWAKYKAVELELPTVSDYVFRLIEMDKKQNLLERE